MQYVLPVCSCCRRLIWQSCLAEIVSHSEFPGGHHAIVTPAYTSACQLGTCDIRQHCIFYVVHLLLPSGEQAIFIWLVRLTLLALFVTDMSIAMSHESRCLYSPILSHCRLSIPALAECPSVTRVDDGRRFRTCRRHSNGQMLKCNECGS